MWLWDTAVTVVHRRRAVGRIGASFYQPSVEIVTALQVSISYCRRSISFETSLYGKGIRRFHTASAQSLSGQYAGGMIFSGSHFPSDAGRPRHRLEHQRCSVSPWPRRLLTSLYLCRVNVNFVLHIAAIWSTKLTCLRLITLPPVYGERCASLEGTSVMPA